MNFVGSCESLEQFFIEMYPYGQSEDGMTFDEEANYKMQDFETKWALVFAMYSLSDGESLSVRVVSSASEL